MIKKMMRMRKKYAGSNPFSFLLASGLFLVTECFQVSGHASTLWSLKESVLSSLQTSSAQVPEESLFLCVSDVGFFGEEFRYCGDQLLGRAHIPLGFFASLPGLSSSASNRGRSHLLRGLILPCMRRSGYVAHIGQGGGQAQCFCSSIKDRSRFECAGATFDLAQRSLSASETFSLGIRGGLGWRKSKDFMGGVALEYLRKGLQIECHGSVGSTYANAKHFLWLFGVEATTTFLDIGRVLFASVQLKSNYFGKNFYPVQEAGGWQLSVEPLVTLNIPFLHVAFNFGSPRLFLGLFEWFDEKVGFEKLNLRPSMTCSYSKRITYLYPGKSNLLAIKEMMRHTPLMTSIHSRLPWGDIDNSVEGLSRSNGGACERRDYIIYVPCWLLINPRAQQASEQAQGSPGRS